MSNKTNLIGKSIGDYLIIGTLGQGGFANVFLAEHKKTSQKVAVKIAKGLLYSREDSGNKPNNALPVVFTTCGDPIRIEMDLWQINQLLEREAEALQKITHPSFVKVLDKGAYYGLFYIVLEYIEGKTLRTIIESQQTIPLHYFIEIINTLISVEKEGLEFHGDIKPENILISHDGLIKIIDPSSPSWEVSDLGSPRRITTPLYNPFFAPDDINSLGILLYEIFTGFLPFNHSLLDVKSLTYDRRVTAFIDPIQLNPEMPGGVKDIILRALQIKEKGDTFIYSWMDDVSYRYQSLSELKKDLEEFMIEGLTFIKIPSHDKTEAVMRAISPYIVEGRNPLFLKKVLNYIINYHPYPVSTR